MYKIAQVSLEPVRQVDQFSCVAASLYMCLKALEVECSLKEVSKVMGVKPMVGASWEDAMAAAQHYGMRATLTMPSTIGQLKEWTDAGVPVIIGWNPEGRPWSHASVVFDVKEDGSVYVADPNIPDPEETVRVVPRKDFYKKWAEKAHKYLIRRPALAIEREITENGRQIPPRIPELFKSSIMKMAKKFPGLEVKRLILGGSKMNKKMEAYVVNQLEKRFGANEVLMRMTLLFGNQQCLRWLRQTSLVEKSDEGKAVDLVFAVCNQGECSQLLKEVFTKMPEPDRKVLVEALGGIPTQTRFAGQVRKMAKKTESAKKARYPEGEMTEAEKKKWEEENPELAENAENYEKYLKSASAKRVARQYIRNRMSR